MTTASEAHINSRREFEILRSQLELERASFLPHWRDLSDYILPRRSRFQTTDTNRGDRRNLKIINSTATLAMRTLKSGMMSGITSPARPWFKLTTEDPELGEYEPVKEWLDHCGRHMSLVYAESNLYNSLPIVYGDMGTFATAAMLVEEDLDDGIRTYTFPIGSYSISNNYQGKVDVFYRLFRMTVRQIVQRFGKKDDTTGKVDWSNISLHVKNLWDQALYEAWVDVVHVISPNPHWDPQQAHSKYKRYRSVYYEHGFSGTSTSANYLGDDYPYLFLRESGYDYFPVLCPRWEVTGEDSYGTDCPGMTALGDIKALQTMEKRKAQAIEKMVNPPMVGPSALRSQKASILPGDITYSDEREGQKGFRPAHEVQLRIQELVEDIRGHESRIDSAMFKDLFLMMAESDRREITAREIDERREEKLLALGPVLEQLNQDLLDPLTDVTFNFMLRQRRLPPPPPEMHGAKLGVEYISVMAQAQKLVGVAAIDRFSTFAVNLAVNTKDPTVLDKVNHDRMLDTYGDLTGVPAGIVRDDEAVASIRQGRAQQQQQAQQAEQLQGVAAAAKNLSQADTSGDNGLTRLMAAANAGSLTPSAGGA